MVSIPQGPRKSGAARIQKVNIDFSPSDFESRLETSEALEKKLETMLEEAEEEVQALKTADGGKLTQTTSFTKDQNSSDHQDQTIPDGPLPEVSST